MQTFKLTYTCQDKHRDSTSISAKDAVSAKELLIQLVPDVVKITKVEITS